MTGLLGPVSEARGQTMTFDEWWDTTKTESTPETYKGWENSCRQAWYAARKHEPESVPELRAQLQTLGLWIAEALPTLDTVEPECSTEAELLTALIRKGEMLVLSSLARGGALRPKDNGHDSDCATHNAPAYPPGPCDCMPTQAMCRAAVVYLNGADVYDKLPREALEIEEGIYAEVWNAMQAAAPKA
ncbi:MAG: hypothetical protein ACK5QX_03970 [bacterium]